MKSCILSRLAVFAVATSLGLAGAAGAAAQTCPNGGTTVYAHVVAIDQPITNNRLGASLPGGMIFALARDVCATSSSSSGCATGPISAGSAMLKPYKRPRPIVLRVNQGQCLQIGFTNLLSDSAATGQPSTRAASVHVQGMNLVKTSTCGSSGIGPTCNDGSWVGDNPSGLVSPATQPLDPENPQPQITYTLYAPEEGAFLLYSTGDTFTAPGSGDGGQLAFGLFGAVHVEPAQAKWYRSQVTAADLAVATKGKSKYGQPLIDYAAVYRVPEPSSTCFELGTCRVGPVLRMTCSAKDAANKANRCRTNEIVHSDLTAVIAGPTGGRFPAERPEQPTMRSSYSLPDRLQPFREFTIIYHEMFNIQQAFPNYYNQSDSQGNNLTATSNGEGQDQFAINYGTGGIGSEVVANRLGVGPMADCTTCKFEEFFLTSWAVGDPAMVVDNPATNQCTCPSNAASCPLDQYTCTPAPATKALYPDDPSNVYHSYISDHTKFRVLHGGVDLHHVHHQHAHQWLHSPDTSNGDYLDSQSIGPGSAFSLEMTYNASGNVNQTVGDSIFHCHFYPHFAGGMWSLWRVHDVYETGTLLDANGTPKTGINRALPDGEIVAGTPIPAVVPLPTIPMPPMPGKVRLAQDTELGGTVVEVCDDQGGNCVSALSSRAGGSAAYRNPGFPFFIPGVGGQRAPHPPLDFAKDDDGTLMDGGLPRHLILACPQGQTCTEAAPLADFTDFSKTLTSAQAIELPEDGTFVEKLAMRFHSQRLVPSVTPENKILTHNAYQHPPLMRKADFILNGLQPVAGAPFADPCIEYDLDGGRPKWHALRRYKAADIQLDVTFNKEGWHFPQQRILSLWGDVADYLKGAKPPEPFFFRANSGDCIEYVLANLVPNVYELDDFQVRTPTDIIGQHIHLVKFDVTSSDGATNGFNYEDGTLAPNEVTERIVAINATGGLWPDASMTGSRERLTAKTLSFFGPGPGGQWVGAQATVQRWYTDRLFDGTIQRPGVDRTLRTVFTHDHFGPSTHQQAGLYAGLVIEPEDSAWYHNEDPSGPPFGGDGRDGKPLPPRTVKGYDGNTTQDGGPTTWQAVIVPNSSPAASFREFLFEFQDTTLTYEPFGADITAPSLSQGFCENAPQTACTPSTAKSFDQPNTSCGTGRCIGYGFCSTDPKVACRPGTATAREDVSRCPKRQNVLATCNFIPGIPSSNAASSNNPPVVPVATWPTTALDVTNGVELITLSNATNSFSINYRSEPLFLRIDDAKGDVASGQAGDLSWAYASIPRPNLSCAFPSSPTCDPYPKALTAGVGPNDPFTPLLRAYAGDDVQIRTLVGAHINPHNFTVHGVKWLNEPSFVDSGWRNSQVMGISEHFEEVFKLPAVTGAGDSDYLYMSGAAAIEQAGGGWGLMRAYASSRSDLRPLPQNQKPASAPVCPPDLPASQRRSYTVVALTAKQALAGQQLVYNQRGSATMADPNAILYFRLEDLDCATPSTSCKAKSQKPEPLVLRANAGDCLTVTLYNAIDGALGAGTQSRNPFCGAPGATPVPCNSNTSTAVGLHPQLVSFDVLTSNGFNVGNNPPQTVAALTSGSSVSCPADPKAQVNCATYTWYAGNIDPKAPAGQQHIPIEFGAANLLPSDVLNHFQYGLFGALVIEPPGSSCVVGGKEVPIEACGGTSALIRSRSQSFREHVLITQDGLQGPAGPGNPNPFLFQTAFLAGDNINAVNYRFEPLNANNITRQCSSSADLSCVLSNTAQCCSGVSNNACSFSTCGEPQTPIFEACAGEQVRFRILHPGGINTNQVFELYGHVWQEQPYMSRGKGCPKPAPTTQTNLYSSSEIGTRNGCDPLERDTYSEFQGARMGHGPTNHFDVLIPSAGGAAKVPGDYLYRSYPADHFKLGLWGIFRVNACGGKQAATASEPAGEGEGR